MAELFSGASFDTDLVCCASHTASLGWGPT
jgi:hypothetical protein